MFLEFTFISNSSMKKKACESGDTFYLSMHLEVRFFLNISYIISVKKIIFFGKTFFVSFWVYWPLRAASPLQYDWLKPTENKCMRHRIKALSRAFKRGSKQQEIKSQTKVCNYLRKYRELLLSNLCCQKLYCKRSLCIKVITFSSAGREVVNMQLFITFWK